MRYPFIEQHRGLFRVRTMCRVLEVSASGYYAWRHRGPSLRGRADTRLLLDIRVIYLEAKRRYGSPRIFEELCAMLTTVYF